MGKKKRGRTAKERSKSCFFHPKALEKESLRYCSESGKQLKGKRKSEKKRQTATKHLKKRKGFRKKKIS